MGRQQPRQVPRLRKCRPVRQRAGQILAKPRTHLAGEGARRLQPAREVFGTVRKPKALQLRRTACRVLAHQHEIASVGHQHQPVAAPVAAYLIARRSEPGVVLDRLHLDHAALRRLSSARAALLHLLRRVEAEVGMARTVVGELLDAEHLRLQRRPDGVQQPRERTVARPLPGRPAGGAHLPQIGEVRLHRRRELHVHSRCRAARMARQIFSDVSGMSRPRTP